MQPPLAAQASPHIQIPSKVQAAQTYLYYANQIRNPSNHSLAGDCPVSGGELSKREEATYNAALDVLKSYFLGEMDFGDTDSGHQPPDRQEPRSPVPVEE